MLLKNNEFHSKEKFVKYSEQSINMLCKIHVLKNTNFDIFGFEIIQGRVNWPYLLRLGDLPVFKCSVH